MVGLQTDVGGGIKVRLDATFFHWRLCSQQCAPKHYTATSTHNPRLIHL